MYRDGVEVVITMRLGIVWGSASRYYQQPGENIRLVEWRCSGLFLMPLGIVWGNASRCYQQAGENIRLVEWPFSGLFLMPLGIVWGNASRCHQHQGENISPQLSVLEIDIVLAHRNSPVDTEQAHRLCGVRQGRVMSPDRPEVLKLH